MYFIFALLLPLFVYTGLQVWRLSTCLHYDYWLSYIFTALLWIWMMIAISYY